MSGRLITIFMRDDNHFDVREADRYCEGLCWDEMLGQIAHLTHPKINEPRYHMMTSEQHAERRRQHEQRMADIAAGKHNMPAFMLAQGEPTTNEEEGKQS